MLKKIMIALGVIVVLLVGGYFALVQFLINRTDVAEAQALVGQKAPSIIVKSYPGREALPLSSLYEKKPIYLNFWATWCPPCVREMPHMEELYPEYRDKLGFVIVSVDSKLTDLEAFLAKNKYTFPIYTTNNKEASDAYNLLGIPTSIIIGTDGNIKAVHVGGMSREDMKAFLDSVQK